jgi:hypothetical protein
VEQYQKQVWEEENAATRLREVRSMYCVNNKELRDKQREGERLLRERRKEKEEKAIR